MRLGNEMKQLADDILLRKGGSFVPDFGLDKIPEKG